MSEAQSKVYFSLRCSDVLVRLLGADVPTEACSPLALLEACKKYSSLLAVEVIAVQTDGGQALIWPCIPEISRRRG